MKRYLSGILTGFILALSVGGFSAGVIKSAQYSDWEMYVNGSKLNSQLVAVTEVGQVNVKNYAPVRDISEALGAKVTASGRRIDIDTPKELSVDDVYKSCVDSCVMIRVYDTTDPSTAKYVGQGSGVILDNGWILTNKHVTDLGVMFGIQYQDYTSTQELRSVEVKTFTTGLDIALIRNPRTDSDPVKIGNSDNVKIADKVVSISSPHGLKNTVTSGIVSAINKGDGFTEIQATSQTDNGSSGGAVFNIYGELISITYAGMQGDEDKHTLSIAINDILKLIK